MLRHNVSDAVTTNFEQVLYLVIVFPPLNPAEFALKFEIKRIRLMIKHTLKVPVILCFKTVKHPQKIFKN